MCVGNVMVIHQIIFQSEPNWWTNWYWPDCFLLSFFTRDCVPGVSVHSLLRALHHCTAFLPGWHLRLQESLVLCRRLLALLSLLDVAAFPGLEQLRARGTWHHVFRPVAPPLAHQRVICVVSVHLLSAAAPSAYGLLLRQNPCCNQEGEGHRCFTCPSFSAQMGNILKEIPT